MFQIVARSIITALFLVSLGGLASAAEVSGTVASTNDTKIVLSDGTEVWAADGMTLPQVAEGTKVKVSYEEKDGRRIVTGLEFENN